MLLWENSVLKVDISYKMEPGLDTRQYGFLSISCLSMLEGILIVWIVLFNLTTLFMLQNYIYLLILSSQLKITVNNLSLNITTP